MTAELSSSMRKYLTNDDVPWLSIEEIRNRFPDMMVNDIDLATKHIKPMLSLENLYGVDDYNKFLSQIRKKLNLAVDSPIEFCVEPKFDGLAISLTYANGKLESAFTRGNGQVGEDVLPMVRHMSRIPQTLNKEISKLTVRGEVFLARDDFRDINAKRLSQNKTLYKTPRNTAVGLLKAKEPSEETDKLSFFAYSLVDISPKHLLPSTQFDVLKFLETLGLPVNPLCFKVTSVDMFKVIGEIQHERPTLPYAIDGAVIKVNDLKYQEILGESSTSPYWAKAWKYPSSVGYTCLEDVIWSVGRLGTVTPVAKLTPVTIDGVTIERATLHNLDYIRYLKLQKNSYVTVERAGDVIPGIVGRALDPRENPVYESIEPPQYCPSCIRELQVKDKFLWCSGGYDCSDQAVQSLAYFCSKHCLDISLMGIETVKTFYALGFIKTPDSIFSLLDKKEIIEKLPGWSKKKTEKLLKGIKSKQEGKNDIVRVVMGLGIPMVGKRTARLLCDTLSSCTWENLINKLEFPETLPVGPMTQSAIRVFWSSLENKEMVRRLSVFLPLLEDSSAMGLITSKRHPTSSTVCISGTIKGLTRDEAKLEVERLGYRVVDSVTKATDHLVIGDSPGAKKVSKAKELNIPISDWDTFCKNS